MFWFRLRFALFEVLASVGSAVVLLACSAAVPRDNYEPPLSGPLAQITFDSRSITGISSASGSFLNFQIHDCLGDTGSFVRVPPKESKTVNVPAQEPIYVSLRTMTQGSADTVYFSFTPQNGQSYGVVFTKLLGPAGAPSMKIEVSDDQQRPVPIERGTKGWPRCETESNESKSSSAGTARSCRTV